MKILTLAALLFSINLYAFNLSPEIAKLNTEFGNTKSYPIHIFDKKILKKKINGKSEELQLDIIVKYISDTIGVVITSYQADTILRYHTDMDGSASALPFQDSFFESYKFCAVFPSGKEVNQVEELNRFLGITAGQNPYPEELLKEAQKLISLRELKLYSLYHELSHCLDAHFAPKTDNSPSAIHEAESYAEVSASLMLAKRFRIKNLILRRALLRSLYARYMGHFLATSNLPTFDPSIRSGGAIYFLTPTLLAANKLASSFDFITNLVSSEEIDAHALNIVNEHALDNRDISALRAYFTQGKLMAIGKYQELSEDFPEAFIPTYLKLRSNINTLEDIDFLIHTMSGSTKIIIPFLRFNSLPGIQ